MDALPPDWALLIVDMQNDFLDKGGYYARREVLQKRSDWAGLSSDKQRSLLEDAAGTLGHGSRAPAIDQVVANICAAIAAARAADRPIAFVRAVYDRSFDVQPPLLANDPDRRHFPCRAGTWGAAFYGGIAAAVADTRGDKERIIEKHTYDAFTNPALPAFLEDMAVSTVVVCGTETQVCVLSSAQHAALRGFRTFILQDCVWSADDETASAALPIFRDAYGATLRLGELGVPAAPG